MHILESCLVASRFLFQRDVDFGFSPLIAIEYGFCNGTHFCIGHGLSSMGNGN